MRDLHGSNDIGRAAVGSMPMCLKNGEVSKDFWTRLFNSPTRVDFAATLELRGGIYSYILGCHPGTPVLPKSPGCVSNTRKDPDPPQTKEKD